MNKWIVTPVSVINLYDYDYDYTLINPYCRKKFKLIGLIWLQFKMLKVFLESHPFFSNVIFGKIMYQLVKLTAAIWLLQLVISSPLIHALGDLSQAHTKI